jgi:CRP/FNR family transcriptional regulator
MSECFCQVDDCVLCVAQLHSSLSLEQVCEVRGLLTRQRFEPHQSLFLAGEPNTHLYVVREGQIKLTTLSSDGREQIIGLGLAGHLIGFDDVRDTAHTYSAVALTSAQVCKVAHADMLKILAENPQAMMRAINVLNEELGRAQSVIRLLGHKTSSERVASFLLSLLPPGKHNGDPLDVPLPLSRQEMAELLGLTIETVSRHMSELKREGIIDAPRGRVQILNTPRLQALAGT